ncbi:MULTISPECIES: alpha-glucan family phosphorylase [unclassified Thermosynechococcus]|uniref:alpha-glucan family phosphorylase n=1 Tax=unclassified Thermosynechococcus TaxID=2622553 RepID=UPI00267303DD|nr:MULTISPECIES: alpha-glucan family phosphorylase [unclassified Thermosynechococcus]WKT82732.1 alpha-glucan family phosphorylase [Thermosynechococcus sp. HY596]WNC61859.1 alpha-glucan family phosphorylase [Thermosynechococcus sp. HY591]WNC64413.1 alpha-glucan family phosphorylase [Thermosynechococcus sp. HY593]
MKPIRTFNVRPHLPQRLEPLRELAYNLYWTWNTEAIALFRRLDPELWEQTNHNPVALLGRIRQDRLLDAAADNGFLAQMERVISQFQEYAQPVQTWYQQTRTDAPPGECIAYFSLEFGLTECLPIYSGGLGVLAGDHLKSASDLGLPLVGVGLLYQKGYFSQYLSADGWQQERYPSNDFYTLPLKLVTTGQGQEHRIRVDYPNREVQARVWQVQVGRVPLYLLDTNLPENSTYDQQITDYLYGGDMDMRIHQEMLLGIGGVRLLHSLGLRPTVYHMNEGHSAFLSLERIRQLITEEQLTYDEALQVVKASQLFTTHTPVPAGIDLFPADKVTYYVGHYAEAFNLSQQEFLSLGRVNPGAFQEPFSMANLAIHTASFVNGVSALHGEVSRQMFQGLWPNLPPTEVPITSITNGVHARSRVSEPLQYLLDIYLGPQWSDAPLADPLWSRVSSIPDEELWRIHEICRYQLVMFVRSRLQRMLEEQGASSAELTQAAEVLDPTALTIGFARRFATYKRATLFLRDVERLRRILLGSIPVKTGAKQRRPIVQFVIAGKAHPKDNPGKELIQEIIHFTRQEGMANHIAFIPDYDMHVAKMMVAGCDVWLNTPLRPQEASGTSGMKAAMNGLPNLSTLDGWWDEADYVKTGWAIGHGETYDDRHYQDLVEANALYERLERDVIPLFYDRDENGVPRGWVQKMKAALSLNTPQFNTARMVREYAHRGYFPASDRSFILKENNYAAAKELARWKAHIFEHWYSIQIIGVETSAEHNLEVNELVEVKAVIALGALLPSDVQVILFQGRVNEAGTLEEACPTLMTFVGTTPEGHSLYTAEMSYDTSGHQGIALQLLPRHAYLSHPYEMGLVLWA